MAQVFISYAKKDYIAPDGNAIPGNLILLYLVVKCAIVVIGHWFEGFMNLARFLETFRY